MPQSLNARALEAIRARLADPGGRDDQHLMESMLRLSATWRSMLLANTLVARQGPVVQNGPFAGMTYLTQASEGALLPRLLGAYESELHPHLEALAREGLDTIVDVGCAEGYYAVGMARMMPAATVQAFDIDPAARAACERLAELNGVADRVRVGEGFKGEDFARFDPARTLIFMDIEGDERFLLDPTLYPALRSLRILVETHPIPVNDVTALIADRFAATHDIVRVEQQPKTTPLPPWLADMGHMDQLLAGWEWRLHPTPWLVMRPKLA